MKQTKDFGTASIDKVARSLTKKGYKSLAKIIKPPKCKCGVRLAMRNGLPINRLCPKCRLEKKKVKAEKHKLTKTYDKKNFKTLHAKCWKLMSLIVRYRGSRHGTNNCYTCNVHLPITELQAGHHFHDKLDFDFRNLRPQCQRCNKYLHGNLGIYAERLIDENGKDWYKQLRHDAQNSIYKTQDLINLLPLLQEEAKQYDK